MIICICRGVSDRDVNRAIAEGASSIAELQSCGIGTDCGSCHPTLRSMLLAARAADAAAAISAVEIPAEHPVEQAPAV